MSHLPFVITAYLLNAIAVTIDKFLLAEHFDHPLVYVFYFSAFSLLAFFGLPFTHIPHLEAFVLASTSTLLWTTGAYLMFSALQKGLVSRVIPLIGALIPIILTFVAYFTNQITYNEVWAIGILILGMFLLIVYDLKGKISYKEVLLILASAIFFALSYLVLHEAYQGEEFLTVFVWSRFILIPVGLILLLMPKTRSIILHKKNSPKQSFFSKMGLLFLIGQMAGGASELLLTFSISLATPALVNSLQGTQYAFLFILTLILAKRFPKIYDNSLTKLKFISKVSGIIFLGFGLFILANSAKANLNTMQLGITFSPRYAESLELNPHEVYSELVHDVNVKKIRLPVYWDEVEKDPGQYDFSAVDYYLQEAESNGIEVILGLGFKQPRWPECFLPEWAENYSEEERDQAILKLVQAEINHFKNSPAIVAWQVENEPFLNFGVCPKVTKNTLTRLEEEIKIIKVSDTRPVLITDSGELSSWRKTMTASDIFGTTLYRVVWNPILGTSSYPLPPFFYQTKNYLVKKLTNSENKLSLVIELQAEPWVNGAPHISQMPLESQLKQFPPDQILKNLSFATETKIGDSYLWGAEWWYWMRNQGHPEYLEIAKKLFNE